jgi:hypothetical protein
MARSTRSADASSDNSGGGVAVAYASPRRSSDPPELVEPILDHLWNEWEDGAGSSRFGLDEDDPNVPEPKSREELLGIFPDEQLLSIRTTNDDGEPLLMDPFDSECMGVPTELQKYYVEHATMVSTWSSPESTDLPEIRRVATALGWRVEEGSFEDLPRYGW